MLRANPRVRDYSEWRSAARALLRDGVRPEQVAWSSATDPQPLLFEPERVETGELQRPLLIPRPFLKLAELVSRHSDPRRWELLYSAAWRVTRGERHLLELETDDQVM